MASVWTGVITFGLVSIPVKLYVAARPETVSFNQLHAVCRSRLRQKLFCPTCERDVESIDTTAGAAALAMSAPRTHDAIAISALSISSC